MEKNRSTFLQMVSVVTMLTLATASAAEAQAVKEGADVGPSSETARRAAETPRTDDHNREARDREAREREEADRAREDARREHEVRERMRNHDTHSAAPATPGIKEDPKAKAARSITHYMLSHE